MAADSRMSEGGLCFMVPSPLTAIVALASPERLAVGAAIRCPGRKCGAPGRALNVSGPDGRQVLR